MKLSLCLSARQRSQDFDTTSFFYIFSISSFANNRIIGRIFERKLKSRNVIRSDVRGLGSFRRNSYAQYGVFLNKNFIQSCMLAIYLYTKCSESVHQHVAGIPEHDKACS